MLYVARGVINDLSMSLRLWELSRQSVDAGVEIPVIRSSELRTTTTELMSVPLHGNFRLMLRVYDTVHKEARFRVRIYAQEEGIGDSVPLIETELVATTAGEGPFRLEPAYAQYSGIESLLLNPVPRPDFVRVKIEPLTEGSMFWALVAITNNETQRVTLVTPQ